MMKKDYQKPEIEMVSLITPEKVTGDELLEGDMGTSASIF